jgi:Skp family chaperone for outer membrane proteins
MFKKMIVAALIAGSMMVGTGALAVEEGIVTVDMDRIFNQYYKTELADAQLKEQADQFNEERKEMVEQYDSMQEEFQTLREEAQNMAMSEDVRNEKRDAAEELLLEIREQEQKVRRMEQQRRKQLEDQQRRMRARIVEEINDTIENFARERSYLAVLDSSGQSLNGVSIILYSSGRLDVTEDILAILNKGAQ